MALHTTSNGEESVTPFTGERGVCQAFRVRSWPCPYTSGRSRRRLFSERRRRDSGRSVVGVVRKLDRRGVAGLAAVGGVALPQRDRLQSERGRLDGRAPRVPGRLTELESLPWRAIALRLRAGRLEGEIEPRRAVGLAPARRAAARELPRSAGAGCCALSLGVGRSSARRPVCSQIDPAKGNRISQAETPDRSARSMEQVTGHTMERVHTILTQFASRFHSGESPSTAEMRTLRQRVRR